MRRGSFIGGLIMAVILATVPAAAQTPRIKLQLQPRVLNTPSKPTMSPALAGRMVLRNNPGAKLLKIKPLPGGNFAVTIKKGSSITTVTP
jgi:hypothetical protein